MLARESEVTAQEPEKLINEHTVDFGWLKLYFLHCPGGEFDCFPKPPSPPDSTMSRTSLWRGYIATFRLCADGRLELVGYEYPTEPYRNFHFEPVNDFLTGDFSLIFRPFFFGPSTRVPFRNGVIVEDRSRWEIDDQTIHGFVTHVFRSRDTDERKGLLVDIGFTAFLPRFLVPEELRHDLDSLVHRSVDCVIDRMADRSVILKALKFGEPTVDWHENNKEVPTVWFPRNETR
jgi:hypothetical protein